MRLCDCIRLAKNAQTVPLFRWTPFTECIQTIDAIDCFNLFQNLGGCCDGLGNCQITNQGLCSKSGRYFRGPGTFCAEIVNGVEYNRCASGSGGCCNGGICTDVANGQSCINQGGKFYGCGISCESYDCAYAYRGCKASSLEPFVVEQHWGLTDTWLLS